MDSHILRSSAVAAVLLFAACGPKQEAEPSDADYSSRMSKEHQHDAPVASRATQPPPTTPIASQSVQYATIGGKPVTGYLAYPSAAEGGLPGILVFHEWWGLNGNIRAMTDRLAGEGYVALAVDVYGGRIANDADSARTFMEQAMKDAESLRQNLRQAHAYLKDQVKATRIGTIGWCFGGGLSLREALLMPAQVDATVVYYGPLSTDPEELKPLKAPLLGVFGGADESIPVADVRKFEATLKALGKDVEIRIYEGAGHAFANPSGTAYEADAAEDAWQRSIQFLAAHLKSG